jgi:hypothetical protein
MDVPRLVSDAITQIVRFLDDTFGHMYCYSKCCGQSECRCRTGGDDSSNSDTEWHSITEAG